MLGRMRALLNRLLAGYESPPESPRDPYSHVRQPRPHRPSGRLTAVAVAEPEPDRSVDVRGQSWNSRATSNDRPASAGDAAAPDS
jgi:hypothetical protein